MTEVPFTLLDDGRVLSVPATVSEGSVRISPEGVLGALGWSLESEGLCRDDVCIPVRDPGALRDDRGVDLAALAAVLGRPLALDPGERVAALGTPAPERAAGLASLAAPDFSLSDLEGRSHALSDWRGRKVLLVAWASW
jgi:hypothetical protein